MHCSCTSYQKKTPPAPKTQGLIQTHVTRQFSLLFGAYCVQKNSTTKNKISETFFWLYNKTNKMDGREQKCPLRKLPQKSDSNETNKKQQKTVEEPSELFGAQLVELSEDKQPDAAHVSGMLNRMPVLRFSGVPELTFHHVAFVVGVRSDDDRQTVLIDIQANDVDKDSIKPPDHELSITFDLASFRWQSLTQEHGLICEVNDGKHSFEAYARKRGQNTILIDAVDDLVFYIHCPIQVFGDDVALALERLQKRA